MTVTRSNVRQNPAYRPASLFTCRFSGLVNRGSPSRALYQCAPDFVGSTDKPYAGLLAALAAYRTNLAAFALHLAALAV